MGVRRVGESDVVNAVWALQSGLKTADWYLWQQPSIAWNAAARIRLVPMHALTPPHLPDFAKLQVVRSALQAKLDSACHLLAIVDETVSPVLLSADPVPLVAQPAEYAVSTFQLPMHTFDWATVNTHVFREECVTDLESGAHYPQLLISPTTVAASQFLVPTAVWGFLLTQCDDENPLKAVAARWWLLVHSIVGEARLFKGLLRFVSRTISAVLRLMRTPRLFWQIVVIQSSWFQAHGCHPPRRIDATPPWCTAVVRVAML